MSVIRSIVRTLSGRRPRSPSLLQGRELELNRSTAPGTSTFVVGVGRSGTHFLAKVMGEDPTIYANHLDSIGDPVGDSFLAYAAWYRLPVDVGGFIAGRRALISDAAADDRPYLEANPYLSFSLHELHQRFGSRFIVLVRRPEHVVASHEAKGWYSRAPIRLDPAQAPGYQYDARAPNHAFGRIVPLGEEYERWCRLTQVGRIAWMWNAHNLRILEQLEALPSEDVTLVQTESIDFSVYNRLHAFVGGREPLSEPAFEKILRSRPGKGPRKRGSSEWSDDERREFHEETRSARVRLGYLRPDEAEATNTSAH